MLNINIVLRKGIEMEYNLIGNAMDSLNEAILL